MERLSRLSGIYVLTDPVLRPDRAPEEIARAAIAGGARVVQLRDKLRPKDELIALARRIAQIAHGSGALFIANDDPEIALLSGADGVHLGPDDLSPAQARRILGPDRLIGVSVSSVEEALPLAPFASYFGVGAIYGSSTKGDAGPPIGTEPIRAIHAAFPDIPLVAIGRIHKGNLEAVKRAGAICAAVVSAVVCAQDMETATRELVQAWESG